MKVRKRVGKWIIFWVPAGRLCWNIEENIITKLLFSDSRIWINLCKKNETSEGVVAAGFTGLYHTNDENPSEISSIKAFPTLTFIELLNKNDEIWVSVGRNHLKSSLKTELENPAIFTIKMISAKNESS